MERRRGPKPPPPSRSRNRAQRRKADSLVVSVAILPTQKSTASSGDSPSASPDVGEAGAWLAYSILDHRLATRDRYEGAERAAYIAEAVRQARMALDGFTIDQILESAA